MLVTVVLQLKETSQPVIHNNVISTYTKGPLLCISEVDKVYKYPLANVWRYTEDHGWQRDPEQYKKEE